MIKVLLWDIDGTILDFLAAERAALNACFEKLDLGVCTDERVERYSKINHKYWRLLEEGKMEKQDILVKRFEEFFAEEGLPVEKGKAFNEEYQVRLGDTIVFRDDAYTVLTRLKEKGYKQYAVTNGTKTAQTNKLRRANLNEIFEKVFISEDLGYEKPNRKFFDIVLEEIGSYKKEEILIIGDSLTSDIQGGLNAGIKTCWYNPNHTKNERYMNINYEVDDLNTIPTILEE